MDIEKERQDFERWFRDLFTTSLDISPYGNYIEPRARHSWAGWKAKAENSQVHNSSAAWYPINGA